MVIVATLSAFVAGLTFGVFFARRGQPSAPRDESLQWKHESLRHALRRLAISADNVRAWHESRRMAEAVEMVASMREAITSAYHQLGDRKEEAPT